MSLQKEETVLRTLRIPRSLYETLKEDAKEKGSNLNALASRVLTRYVEWDRYADRFGIISFSREVFKGILDTTEPEDLFRTARRLGTRTPKAGILFWFKEASTETFLAGLSNLFRYGRMGECEIKTSGNENVVIIRHDLGTKWSRFLQNYLDSAAQTVLSTRPEFDATPSLVSMRFRSKPDQ